MWASSSWSVRMYLGICEWWGTWKDGAGKMKNRWRDRKGQEFEEGQGKEGERQ